MLGAECEEHLEEKEWESGTVLGGEGEINGIGEKIMVLRKKNSALPIVIETVRWIVKCQSVTMNGSVGEGVKNLSQHVMGLGKWVGKKNSGLMPIV